MSPAHTAGSDADWQVHDDCTFAAAIAKQALRTPNSTALSFKESSLTFVQLGHKVNLVAVGLRKLGVGPDVRVGICHSRNINMVVGMLAILQAGGAYVPLDPSFPEERLTYMIEDSSLEIVLTENALQGPCPRSRPSCSPVPQPILCASPQPLYTLPPCSSAHPPLPLPPTPVIGWALGGK